MWCNAFSMLMIYVIKVARYACGDDAHVLTNRFLMPCIHVLFYLFVSKHKEGCELIVINVGILMQGKWGDQLYIDIGSWWIASKLKKRRISN
jgi:hypothetical protein